MSSARATSDPSDVNARHTTTKPDKTPVGALTRGWIVAAVYSPATLAAALALGPLPGAPDWLELRADHFHAGPEPLQALAAKSPRPLLLTVRHPSEGGAPGAPKGARERGRLYECLSAYPAVVAVDLEVRSLHALSAVVRATRERGRLLVASFHDFRGVPPPGRLRTLAARAQDAGAEIFKVAATVERPDQLARLLDFMAWGQGRRMDLAVMGMGSMGRVSRLALAAAGSVLNYGYLGGGGPQVPGQWPVEMLRARIEECAASRKDGG